MPADVDGQQSNRIVSSKLTTGRILACGIATVISVKRRQQPDQTDLLISTLQVFVADGTILTRRREIF